MKSISFYRHNKFWKRLQKKEIIFTLGISLLIGVALGKVAAIVAILSVFVGSENFKIPSGYVAFACFLGICFNSDIGTVFFALLALILFLITEIPFKDMEDNKFNRREIVASAITFFLLLVNKAIVGLTAMDLAWTAFNTLFVFGGICVFRGFGQFIGIEQAEVYNKENNLYFIIVVLIGAAGLPEFGFGKFHLFIVISIICILFYAYRFGAAYAVCVASICSLVYILMQSSRSALTYMNAEIFCVFGVAGLVSAILFRYGKLTGVLGAGLGAAFATIMIVQEQQTVVSFVNWFVAAVVFLILLYCKSLGIWKFEIATASDINTVIRMQPLPVIVSRLKGISTSIKEYLQIANESVVKSIAPQMDITAVYNKVCNSVCSDCNVREFCWNRNFYNTCGMLSEILDCVQGKTVISKEDIPRKIRDKCSRSTKVAAAINNAFEVYRAELLWKQQLDDAKVVMNQQMQKIGEFITDVVEQNTYVNEQIQIQEEWLHEVIEREFGNNVLTLNVNSKGRMTIEIMAINSYDFPWNCKDIEYVLFEELNVRFKTECVLVEEMRSNRAVFVEKEKYKVAVGHANIIKNSYVESGDCYTNGKIGNGLYLVGISDGMGSGEVASKISANALSLLEGLLESGVELCKAASFVNSIVMLQLGGEAFVTMDNAIVDLYDGEIQLLKVGSAPSIVVHKKDVKIISTTTIPLGLESNSNIKQETLNLTEGDSVILMSDGVFDVYVEAERENELTELIKNVVNYEPEKCANEIVNRTIKFAEKNNITNIDDMSVLVMKMWRTK